MNLLDTIFDAQGLGVEQRRALPPRDVVLDLYRRFRH